MTLNTTDPIIKLTVDASDVPVLLNVFWTCPKCKHGGKDREHSHVSGKCRYAPKATVEFSPPHIAAPAVDEMPAPLAAPLPKVPTPHQVKDPKLFSHEDDILETPVASPSVKSPNEKVWVDPPRPASPVVLTDMQKIKATYQRLKSVKISDVELRLHETLKNLDEAWMKKILISLVGENIMKISVNFQQCET